MNDEFIQTDKICPQYEKILGGNSNEPNEHV